MLRANEMRRELLERLRDRKDARRKCSAMQRKHSGRPRKRDSGIQKRGWCKSYRSAMRETDVLL